MVEQIKNVILNILPILISALALLSNYKIGKKQVSIGELQSELQKNQIAIDKLQTTLQEKQVEVSKLQTDLQVKQIEISQMQIDFQNKVELFVFATVYTPYPGTNIPAIFIKNAGNNVVYLIKYDLNGQERLQNMYVLLPISVCNEVCYRIDLPTDGTTHFSFKLDFEDWKKQKWQTKGYVDFRNGIWELTYSPCERLKE